MDSLTKTGQKNKDSMIFGHDMGVGEKYATEVNCSTAPMPDEE